MNEWSLGQIWDNLIIVQGRTTFEDEKVAAACTAGESLLEDTRGIKEVHANLVKRSKVDGWQVPEIDYDKREVVSQRPFNKLDANKVPVYIVNALMANKCWKSPEKGMEQCWKLPKTEERSGNFVSLAGYCLDSSSSACSGGGSSSDGGSSAYGSAGSSDSYGSSDSSEESSTGGSDSVCCADYDAEDCAYDKEVKHIFINEAKKLVDKMEEMKTRPMCPSWMIHEVELQKDIRKFNKLEKSAVTDVLSNKFSKFGIC